MIAVNLSDLSADTLSQIKVIQVGSSADLQVGEQVVAIGNALGYGQSVTTGIVSALNRPVTIDGVTNTLIQTDAAINPGNSGGALLNMSGQAGRHQFSEILRHHRRGNGLRDSGG